jgi:hypothetical protein
MLPPPTAVARFKHGNRDEADGARGESEAHEYDDMCHRHESPSVKARTRFLV